METVLWILLCTLCIIGAVDLYGRIAYGRQRTGRYYHVVPLACADMQEMRRQLEYYLARIEWAGQDLPVVFVHDGLSAEQRKLFDLYLGELHNVRLCDTDTLCALLTDDRRGYSATSDTKRQPN